ncbi:lysine transporter LysE [Halomonas sp. 1513]|nr:LysE family translocator [Halomonas sp. 1513]APX93735.1 lysine transporter LysE [Halomonas sp. 1513]
MELWVFTSTLVIVYLLPGPDMILVLQTGVANGRLPALATAAGLAVARGAHVLLAATGLAALFAASPWTLDVIRLVGACYLIWLGIQILLSGPGLAVVDAIRPPTPSMELKAACKRGLLTNLLNPKSLLFCSVLLPQFLNAERSDILLQFLLLGSLVVGVGILFDTLYAMAASLLREWLTSHPMMQRLQRGVFSALLIGFGAQLMAS